jgi:hypothetical protein
MNTAADHHDILHAALVDAETIPLPSPGAWTLLTGLSPAAPHCRHPAAHNARLMQLTSRSPRSAPPQMRTSGIWCALQPERHIGNSPPYQLEHIRSPLTQHKGSCYIRPGGICPHPGQRRRIPLIKLDAWVSWASVGQSAPSHIEKERAGKGHSHSEHLVN